MISAQTLSRGERFRFEDRQYRTHSVEVYAQHVALGPLSRTVCIETTTGTLLVLPQSAQVEFLGR